MPDVLHKPRSVVQDEVMTDREIIEAIRAWVARHPRPDLPVRVPVGGQAMSPRDLLYEVERHTKTGREFTEGLRGLADEHPRIGMARLLDRIREPGSADDDIFRGFRASF